MDVGDSEASQAAWGKLFGADFKTESAAKLAGEKALAELLASLVDEEKNAS
jgi:hypothetical protein